MTMQARMSSGDDRLYNVNRDVAHNFGELVRFVGKFLEERSWPEMDEVRRACGITDDQLGEAARAFMLFVATATDVREERNPEDALIRVGFRDVPGPAQIAYLAAVGAVASGFYYSGVREATLGGVGPCLTMTDLGEAGLRTACAMALPRWRRRVAALRRGARLWILRRLGAEPVPVSLVVLMEQATAKRRAEVERMAAARRRPGGAE